MPTKFKRLKKTWLRTKNAVANTGTFLDDTINAISPSWGTRRRAIRRMDALNKRQTEIFNAAHWKGAEADRTHGDKWLASRLSPDSALENDLETLRENADELYRNFGFIHGAIEKRVDNVVGTGIRPQARIKPLRIDGRDIITAEQATRYNHELEGVYKRWSPRAGNSGRTTLRSIQRQAVRGWRRFGESLVIFSDVGRMNKPIPLQLDLVTASRLETPPDFEGQENVRLGIRRDDADDIIRYYIRQTHPFDTKDNTPEYDSYEAARVHHIFEKLYDDQSRGLPWCHAIMTEAKDFNDFKEATIIGAQVAACLTLIISTADPKALAAASVNTSSEQEMEPGSIMYRPHTDEINTLIPNQPSTTFGMFSEWNLLGLGAGMNWPFGWLTGDRRRATFSAGKLEEIDGGIGIKNDQQTLVDDLLVDVWDRLVDEAVIVGECSIDPSLFDQYPWAFTEHIWLGPGRQWIEPAREVPALIQAKEHNLIDLSYIHGRLGTDTEETIIRRGHEKQLERDNDAVPPITSGQPDPTQVEEEETVGV